MPCQYASPGHARLRGPFAGNRRFWALARSAPPRRQETGKISALTCYLAYDFIALYGGKESGKNAYSQWNRCLPDERRDLKAECNALRKELKGIAEAYRTSVKVKIAKR
jgi:hypothetical protein